MPSATLVCDIGNVLVTRNPQRQAHWLDDATHYLQTAYMPGIVQVLRTLTEVVGPERAWLLSKCSPETEQRGTGCGGQGGDEPGGLDQTGCR